MFCFCILTFFVWKLPLFQAAKYVFVHMLVSLLRPSMLLGSSARLVGLGDQLGFLATISSHQDTQVLQKVF